jgi:ABC-type transport system involved in cytochrome c biogenesis permease subunit
MVSILIWIGWMVPGFWILDFGVPTETVSTTCIFIPDRSSLASNMRYLFYVHCSISSIGLVLFVRIADEQLIILVTALEGVTAVSPPIPNSGDLA